MNSMLRVLGAAGALSLATVAGAQTTASATAVTPPARIAQGDQITSMKVALRNLITLEEKYWSEHATYTTDGVALGTYPYAKDQPMAQVIFAGARGWTGMATSRTLKGKSCVVFIGVAAELPKIPATSSQQLVAEKEGNPVCDGAGS